MADQNMRDEDRRRRQQEEDRRQSDEQRRQEAEREDAKRDVNTRAVEEQVLEHKGLDPNTSLERFATALESQGSPLAHRTTDDMSPAERGAQQRRETAVLNIRSEEHRLDTIRELDAQASERGDGAEQGDDVNSISAGDDSATERTRGAPEARGDERTHDTDRALDLGHEAARGATIQEEQERDPAVEAALARSREDGRDLETEAARDPLRDRDLDRWSEQATERLERKQPADRGRDAGREAGNRGREEGPDRDETGRG